jgi:ABC-type transport system involved in multi-copper enzyme maturation permease subunit
MTELVQANLRADFAYYRRSRLLLAFMLVSLLLTSLSSLPAFFGDSGVQSFNALQEIVSNLNICLMLLSGGVALFVISAHLRNRSLKMVFTKPCKPSVWLASAFLSAVIVAMLLHLIVLLSAVGLSYWWHVPVRPGLVFILTDNLIASICVIAYLTLLASIAHPAVAATFALIFNADMFYAAHEWTQGALQAGHAGLIMRILDKVFDFLYLALPMVQAFGKQTETIYQSYRVTHGSWKYLAYGLGYAMILSAFCYLTSLYALQRRKYI